MIFFTSDWHLGWESTLVYDERPFQTPEEQNQDLVKRFNNMVKPEDTTYFLGDMGKPKDLLEVLPQLNGKKILIRGNHDKGMQSCMNLGFDLVLEFASFTLGSTTVTLSHYPLKDIHREDTEDGKSVCWHGDYKHQAWSQTGRAQVHLHGHIHSPSFKNNSKPIQIERTGENFLVQIDVGVKAWKYAPFSLKQLESIAAKVKDDKPL